METILATVWRKNWTPGQTSVSWGLNEITQERGRVPELRQVGRRKKKGKMWIERSLGVRIKIIC